MHIQTKFISNGVSMCVLCSILISIILTLMGTFRFLMPVTAFNRKRRCCSLKNILNESKHAEEHIYNLIL